jgi:hypothetical protein
MMENVFAFCAGLDVHKKSVEACVRRLEPSGRLHQQTRHWETMTRDLLAMADWMAAQCVAQRLSELGIIKNPDLPSFQVRRHALGVTEPRQRSLDQDAVVAGKYARDFIGVALGQQFHDLSPTWEEGILEELPSSQNDLTYLVPAMPGVGVAWGFPARYRPRGDSR